MKFHKSLQNLLIAVNFAFPGDIHFGHSRGLFFDNFIFYEPANKKHVELFKITQYILLVLF